MRSTRVIIRRAVNLTLVIGTPWIHTGCLLQGNAANFAHDILYRPTSWRASSSFFRFDRTYSKKIDPASSVLLGTSGCTCGFSIFKMIPLVWTVSCRRLFWYLLSLICYSSDDVHNNENVLLWFQKQFTMHVFYPNVSRDVDSPSPFYRGLVLSWII